MCVDRVPELNTHVSKPKHEWHSLASKEVSFGEIIGYK